MSNGASHIQEFIERHRNDKDSLKYPNKKITAIISNITLKEFQAIMQFLKEEYRERKQ